MRKPRVNTRPVAGHYESAAEKIIEFGAEVNGAYAGGLISFRPDRDGQLLVDVYRVDEGVRVLSKSQSDLQAVANDALQRVAALLDTMGDICKAVEVAQQAVPATSDGYAPLDHARKLCLATSVGRERPGTDREASTTFAEFQATGRDEADLSTVQPDAFEDASPTAGRVYLGCLVISRVDCERSRRTWIGDHWSLLIGSVEYVSTDLVKLERKLYEFAISEGYLPCESPVFSQE